MLQHVNCSGSYTNLQTDRQSDNQTDRHAHKPKKRDQFALAKRKLTDFALTQKFVKVFEFALVCARKQQSEYLTPYTSANA